MTKDEKFIYLGLINGWQTFSLEKNVIVLSLNLTRTRTVIMYYKPGEKGIIEERYWVSRNIIKRKRLTAIYLKPIIDPIVNDKVEGSTCLCDPGKNTQLTLDFIGRIEVK